MSLDKIHVALQLLSAGAAIISALAGVGAFFVGQKVEQANSLKIQESLNNEKNRIKVFSSRITAQVRGNWKKKPSTMQLMNFSTQDFYLEFMELAPKFNGDAKQYATERYTFTEIPGSESVKFESIQAPKPGGFPLGHTNSDLASVRKLDVMIPFINFKGFEGTQVYIENLKIEFTANGSRTGSLSINQPNFSTAIQIPEKSKAIGWAMVSIRIEEAEAKAIFVDFRELKL